VRRSLTLQQVLQTASEQNKSDGADLQKVISALEKAPAKDEDKQQALADLKNLNTQLSAHTKEIDSENQKASENADADIAKWIAEGKAPFANGGTVDGKSGKA
jgi:hypothetical protein